MGYGKCRRCETRVCEGGICRDLQKREIDVQIEMQVVCVYRAD